METQRITSISQQVYQKPGQAKGEMEKAGEKSDLYFSDGVDTPLEVSLSIPSDLLLMMAMGNAGKGKVSVSGEVESASGEKETIDVQQRPQFQGFLSGHYGESALSLDVTGKTEDGMGMKVSGYAGPGKSEKPDKNLEFTINVAAGGFILSGSVNGIPVRESATLDPSILGIRMEGEIGGVTFSRKVSTSEDMQSQIVEGTFGEYQEKGKAYRSDDGSMVFERNYSRKADDGTLKPMYSITERLKGE